MTYSLDRNALTQTRDTAMVTGVNTTLNINTAYALYPLLFDRKEDHAPAPISCAAVGMTSS